MASQKREAKTAEQHLVFVTWNTNGTKNTTNSPDKLTELLKSLNHLQADIAFIQETHVGSECYKIFEDKTGNDWKIFFTVHNSRSKGVAILIRKTVPFEYICHDEDCSGGYIVLFCHLYGEQYTLVNVYNHKADRNVLGRLKEYLMETAKGVLVVGGDFNTVLNPSLDRRPPSSRNSPLRAILEDFTASLNLRDSWSFLHSTDEVDEMRFTRSQNESYSRLDMFFLPENKMESVDSTEVETNRAVQGISDHYPLVLKLRQIERKLPKSKKLEYNFDRRPGKISGAEILSATKSLGYVEEHSTKNVTYYDSWLSYSEDYKKKYNDILMRQQLPKNFHRHIGVEYMVFSEILAKRLNAFLSSETKCDWKTLCAIVTFEERPQYTRWSFLKTAFEKLDYCYKQTSSEYAPFLPPPDFSILEPLLTKRHSRDLRYLQPDCPLTSAILSLALDQLNMIVRRETKCNTTVCYDKQVLFIYEQQSKQFEQVAKLVKKFQDDSGVRLSYR